MIDKIRGPRSGALAVCAASILWGFGYFFRKIVLDDVSPILLAFFTSAIVAIVLPIFFRLRLTDLRQSFVKHPFCYLGLALTGVVLGTSCMFLALRELDLGLTTLLEKLQPILVFVFARLFLRERFPVEKGHWIVLALISSYFLVARFPFDVSFQDINMLGLVAILGAATSWALGTIIGKKVADKSVPSEHITFFRFFWGAVLLSPCFLFRDSLGLTVDWSVRFVVIVTIAALLSTALGFYLFYRGLQHITAGLSGVLEFVTPVMGVLLGVIFLGERMTYTQCIASTVLLFAVYSLMKPNRVQFKN